MIRLLIIIAYFQLFESDNKASQLLSNSHGLLHSLSKLKSILVFKPLEPSFCRLPPHFETTLDFEFNNPSGKLCTASKSPPPLEFKCAVSWRNKLSTAIIFQSPLDQSKVEAAKYSANVNDSASLGFTQQRKCLSRLAMGCRNIKELRIWAMMASLFVVRCGSSLHLFQSRKKKSAFRSNIWTISYTFFQFVV